MHPTLRPFLHLYLGVVAATLLPLVLLSFLWLPLTLGGHPGEPRPADINRIAHMT